MFHNRYYEKIGNNTKDITDDLPFEIPTNWTWIRLKSLSLYFFSGKSPKYSKTINDNIVIGQASNTGNKIDLSFAKYCTDEFKKDMPKFYYLKFGDILLNTLGNGTLGRTGIFNLERQDILTDGHLFVFRMLYQVTASYLYNFLTNNRDMIEKSANGTTNQVFLSSSTVGNYLIPLPPLVEQERIIDKINSFKPLLDQYDKLEKQLTKLESEITDKLKKSILQYAIEGKLVKQDPNDEPASVLLERIKAEKEKLIKEGKIKRDKNESFIYQSDDKNYYEKSDKNILNITSKIPFAIPSNWCWCYLSNLYQVVSSSRVHQKDWKTTGIPFYRAREIAKLCDSGSVNNDLYISQELYKKLSKNGFPKENDIMITAVGTLGKTYIVKKNDVFYYKDASVICLENFYNLNSDYISNIFKSPHMVKHIKEKTAGTTVNTITIEKANKYLIPFPPLSEQKRIIDKIEVLFNML